MSEFWPDVLDNFDNMPTMLSMDGLRNFESLCLFRNHPF